MREREREREKGREGGRERERERGREGGRERERERKREREREGGREGGNTWVLKYCLSESPHYITGPHSVKDSKVVVLRYSQMTSPSPR